MGVNNLNSVPLPNLNLLDKMKVIMTDITKYKNVSLSHKTYDLIDKIRKVIQPDTTLSRSQTISILVNEKARKLNGKTKKD